jgi:hypothetical protein
LRTIDKETSPQGASSGGRRLGHHAPASRRGRLDHQPQTAPVAGRRHPRVLERCPSLPAGEACTPATISNLARLRGTHALPVVQVFKMTGSTGKRHLEELLPAGGASVTMPQRPAGPARAPRRSADSPGRSPGIAGSEEACRAPPGTNESFVCSCALGHQPQAAAGRQPTPPSGPRAPSKARRWGRRAPGDDFRTFPRDRNPLFRRCRC